MIPYLRRSIKHLFDKHPLVANCITYGTFTTSAEFLQQSLALYDDSNNGVPTKDITVSILNKYL